MNPAPQTTSTTSITSGLAPCAQPPVSFEEEYYRDHPLSGGKLHSREDLARVERVLRAVAAESRSLLDVGCASGVCCDHALERCPHLKRVVGIDRNPEAIKHVRAESYVADISGMPFADREFDTSVALEVLEHLPLACFTSAVREIARVTKRQIIVTVPNRENLRRNSVGCPECTTRFHRYLHMRSFDRGKLGELFSEHGFACEAIAALGPRRYLGAGWIRLVVDRLRGRGLAMGWAVCPLCGYRHATADRRRLWQLLQRRRLLRSLARKLWPKTWSRRWLMACYRRVSDAA